ncbi:MAG: hypothetical protein WC547_11230 [Candidatus Omnitrophota bacterium]
MRCKKAQIYIVSEYTEGRLPESIREELRAHIVKCAHCREFVSASEEAMGKGSTEAAFQKAPATLWRALRLAIARRRSVEPSLSDAGPTNRLDRYLSGQRLTFALNAAMCCLIVAMLGASQISFSRKVARSTAAYPDRPASYLSYIMSYPKTQTQASYYYNIL